MDTLGIAMILGMMSGDARRRENEERIRRGEPVRPDPFGNLIVRIVGIVLGIIAWAVGIIIVIMTINALWTYYREELVFGTFMLVALCSIGLWKKQRQS